MNLLMVISIIIDENGDGLRRLRAVHGGIGQGDARGCGRREGQE